ncbi:hypothetical protein P8452_00954 [Trifolium repens]|nr:hypothetical protein P8452_00954 [Trifolium repens]
MIHNQFIFFFLFTFFIASHTAPPPSAASCPMDLSYVETFPWDTSTCRDPVDYGHCCQSLLSLFGIGLAKHLKETSIFQLPNENISTTCLQDFKLKLSSLKLQPSLVPSCFHNSTQFVTNTSSCAGITNITDWKQKVGMLSPLDTSCNVDLSSETSCNICTEAGFKVTAQLRSISPNNSSKCFYYSVLYAIGIVNQLGPTDPVTAGCILGMALSSKGSSNNGKILKLVFGLLGAVVGVILAFVLIVMYRKWNKMRRENLYHRSVENSVRDSVLPNTVMSGRKVLDTMNSPVVLITDWAWTLAKTGKVDEIFDEAVKDEGPEKIMERFVLVGILCAHAMVALRPTIAEALKMLEGDIDIPNLPDRPVPLGHESFQSSLLQGSGRTTPYTSFYSTSNISTISRN